ncbi:MAG: D-alanyl-D-alanine carboxypeptidase/D-alanyl-D-alanine-endopeptidase [Ilumatobacteraceae bacterium]
MGVISTPVLSVRRAPQTIVQLTSEAQLANTLGQISAFVGDTSCLVVSLDGRILFGHNGDIPVTPASNQKLIVAAVALEALGPDYTFTTRVFANVADGVVSGDLYFVGGGDPLLSTADYPATQKYPPTSTTSLESLVQNLVSAGVTRISGNVITDESRYDTERSVPTWANDVRDVEAGPLSALMVDDAVREVGATNVRRVQDPAVGAGTTLISLLKAAGITVGGSARAGTLAADVPELTSVVSAPLSAIVGEMLTTSDDNTAELLVKELGVAAQIGNSRQAGLDVITGTLVTWGVDTSKLTLVDGSGLDKGNIVTCNIIRQVLTHAPLSGPLGVGLPIDGQTGTLADDTALGDAMIGRLHAKTGTLSNVKSLSGFLTTDVGELEFSMILNLEGITDSYVGLWGALGDAFSKYPAGPTVDEIAPTP